MSTKFKFNEKTVTGALYIGAALLIVTIICISVFAFVNQSRKDKNDVPLFTTGDKTESTTAKTVTTTAAPTTTGGKPSSTGDAINTDTKVPVVKYSGPIETGYLLKGHADDLLVYSVTMNDYRIHTGIDIAAAVGTPVFAAADGEISGIFTDSLMGVCIAIKHSGDVVTYYKNLSETLPSGITEGARVERGDIIGSIGETAMVEQADEAHLHFEVAKNGVLTDPLEYVSYSVKDAGAESEK